MNPTTATTILLIVGGGIWLGVWHYNLERDCPYCRKHISRAATVCPACGRDIAMEPKARTSVKDSRAETVVFSVVGVLLLAAAGLALVAKLAV